MSDNSKQAQEIDWFGPWRNLRDASLDAWSKAMIGTVNTDAYGQATGAMLDTYLATAAPMRKAVEAAMTQMLQQFNIPTRTDVVDLAARLTNIEMRLDDQDAKLDEIQRALRQSNGSPRDRSSDSEIK